MVSRERYLLHLLEALGCPARGTTLDLVTTAAEEAAARALCPSDGTSPRVVIAPGASYGSAKRWPVRSFAAVSDALEASGAHVVLVGTEAEVGLGRAIREHARGHPLDLCGRGDLGTLKALLRGASLLVCNDAGARHVATAVGTPAIVLFGPTALEKTDCNLETVDVLETAVSCRPCYHRECPIDHRCMVGIEPEAVLARARTQLSLA